MLAFAQSNDLRKALELLRTVQQAAQQAKPPASGPASAPAPAPRPAASVPVPAAVPSAAAVPAASPAARPSPAGPAVAPDGTRLEPGYVWENNYAIFHVKSILQPGQRIDVDPNEPVTRDNIHPERRNSHEWFSPPEAKTRYADGPRSVVMLYGESLLRYKRVLSNPYIPTERVDLVNPNWVISPYFWQGFFNRIDDFSCRPDGTLWVRGTVGVPADFPSGSAFAKGIWRVQPDGQILAHEVFPDSSYLRGEKYSCNLRTCGLPPHAPRDRAISEGSDDWAQDKHGNVWGFGEKGKTTPGCFLTRFNVDGSQTPIQTHQDLCHLDEGISREFQNLPGAIVYDESRDEMVYSAGSFGGNGPGSLALFRVTQAGKVTELMRNWAHSERPSYKVPAGKRRSDSNQVKERWWGIYNLHFHRPSAAVRFEVSVFSEPNYPGRSYEIRDSFATLKRLPFNTAGQSNRVQFYGSGNDENPLIWADDQKLVDEGINYSMSSAILGSSCMDDAGNTYFSNGSSAGGRHNSSIRRMDPQGRLSTWVR